MKKYKGKYQLHGQKHSKIQEVVLRLQESGQDKVFRDAVGMPEDTEKRKVWIHGLQGENFAQYQALLNDLAAHFSLKPAELAIIEQYLIAGEPIVVTESKRILEKVDPTTRQTELYIRVDGLTIDEAQQLVFAAHESYPDMLAAPQWKPTREWSVLRFKRVYDLRKKGLSETDIADILTHELQQHEKEEGATSEDDISTESVKQILSRGKKKLKRDK